jgi:hypothetical protein
MKLILVTLSLNVAPSSFTSNDTGGVTIASGFKNACLIVPAVMR